MRCVGRVVVGVLSVDVCFAFENLPDFLQVLALKRRKKKKRMKRRRMRRETSIS